MHFHMHMHMQLLRYALNALLNLSREPENQRWLAKHMHLHVYMCICM